MAKRRQRRRRDGGEWFGRAYRSEREVAAGAAGPLGHSILMFLRELSGPHDALEDGYAPTVAEIAAAIHASRRTVERALPKLERAGVIEVDRRTGRSSEVTFGRIIGTLGQFVGGSEEGQSGAPSVGRSVGGGPTIRPTTSDSVSEDVGQGDAPVGRELIPTERRVRQSDDQRAAVAAVGAFTRRTRHTAPGDRNPDEDRRLWEAHQRRKAEALAEAEQKQRRAVEGGAG